MFRLNLCLSRKDLCLSDTDLLLTDVSIIESSTRTIFEESIDLKDYE